MDTPAVAPLSVLPALEPEAVAQMPQQREPAAMEASPAAGEEAVELQLPAALPELVARAALAS